MSVKSIYELVIGLVMMFVGLQLISMRFGFARRYFGVTGEQASEMRKKYPMFLLLMGSFGLIMGVVKVVQQF